jgi:Ribonuclease-III-like
MLQVGRLIRDLFTHSRQTSPEDVQDLPASFDGRTLRRLEQTLDYRIRRKDLFIQALLHRSFPQTTSHPNPSNERLEFLGDSVLNLIVGEYLYRTYPRAPEGDLTKLRSRLVNRKALAAYGRELRLSTFILMSPSAAQSVKDTRPSSPIPSRHSSPPSISTAASTRHGDSWNDRWQKHYHPDRLPLPTRTTKADSSNTHSHMVSACRAT